MSGRGWAPWAIFALALILRAASAFWQGDVVVPLPGVHDQVSYDALAQRVLAGHGFSFASNWWPLTSAGAPTAHWSYLYTLFLTGAYALFGVHALVPRLLQAAVAAFLQPWLTWRIGRRLFGDRAGLLGAAIAAGYAYFAYYAGALMTETFFIIGVLATLDTAVTIRAAVAGRGRASPRSGAASASATVPWSRWVQLGVLIGLTALLRQLFLLIVPFLLVWLFLSIRAIRTEAGEPHGRRWPASALGAGVAVLVAGIVILPATLYNIARFDRFVLLNTNAGFAFFWGNHPVHGTTFQPILPDDGPRYADLVPEELRALDEAALDRALLERGLGFIREAPGRYVLLSLSRIPAYFRFWPAAESSLTSNVARVLSFGLCLPLMLWGLWCAWRRRAELSPGASLLVLFAVVYTGIHLATWALVRYRLPVDAALIPFAGLALHDLLGRVRQRRHEP